MLSGKFDCFFSSINQVLYFNRIHVESFRKILPEDPRFQTFDVSSVMNQNVTDEVRKPEMTRQYRSEIPISDLQNKSAGARTTSKTGYRHGTAATSLDPYSEPQYWHVMLPPLTAESM